MIYEQPSYSRYAFILFLSGILLQSILVEKCSALTPSAAKAVFQQPEILDHYYIALYKPALTLCTFRDDEERAKRKHREARSTLSTVLLDNTGNSGEDELPKNIISMHFSEDDKDQNSRRLLHTCGRLDRDSEGLLLLTTDGSFTSGVCEPKAESEGITKVPKRYLARVKNGIPNDTAMQRMRAGGLVIRGAATRPPVSVHVIEDDSIPELQSLPPPVPGMEDRHKRHHDNTKTQEYAWLEIVLTEGRNRQIRRITADAGHPTARLVRVAIGDLTLANQDLYRPGQWCYITPEDVLGVL